MNDKKDSKQGEKTPINISKLHCLICNRKVRSFCECVANKNDVLCEDCYLDLVFPNLNARDKKELY